MTPQKLVRKLQTVNSKLRVCWSPGKVSGLYFDQPKHPDSHENGLRWIGAIPSPSWFYTLPAKDFFTRRDGKVYDPGDCDNREYHRGWFSVVKMLVEQGHYTKAQIKRALGLDYTNDIFVLGIRGKLTPLPGWNEGTRGDRARKKLAEMV